MLIDKMQLIQKAREARLQAYAPYSNYLVGAAILTGSGTIYTGCNIENASFGGTICAERTAAVKAVSDGQDEFLAVAVVGSPRWHDDLGFAFPCGICRQFLNEFADAAIPVYIARTDDDIVETTLGELLPHAFGPRQLEVE